jgi:hypothetical protein
MNPSAIKGVEVVTDGEAGITLRHPTRGEVQLRGVAAAVWRQADGARSVDELAAAVNADASAVWAALDELGDADLLSERVAPPAGIHENVQREVVFTQDAALSADPDAASKLEAQFDADAADAELVVPEAEERRKQIQEAAQDAEEQAASDATLAALDSRSETADGVMVPDAKAESADGIMLPDAKAESADGVILTDATTESADGVILTDATTETVNVDKDEEEKKPAS